MWLDTPQRDAKPRSRGWTVVLDPGVPLKYFQDVIACYAPLIDLVKFGWGTALVVPQLEAKIACLNEHAVDFVFGGTLFEAFHQAGRLDRFFDWCRRYACRYVEISDGTVPLPPSVKLGLIGRFAREFTVLSEVGDKDAERSARRTPEDWVRAIRAERAAGAAKVITEARESGTSGLCRPDGQVRTAIVDAIVEAAIDPGDLIFEAPTKGLQVFFLRRFGPHVNLGNIPLADIVSVETLRLGLRSDTLTLFGAGGTTGLVPEARDPVSGLPPH
ncbi:MAG: phosphosulfolactate synthase [Actinomycetia bacterium]|nr:phosphosulfolactate synthase [Actinomycetes bacterium]